MNGKQVRTIFRHESEVADESLAPSESLRDVEKHIETHLGKPGIVIHELSSMGVHVDVHVVPPRSDRDFFTLVTSGMSDKPMNAPPPAGELKFAELMLCLPSSWQIKDGDMSIDETWRKDWPTLWLRKLARFPHAFGTWFFWGHSLPNGDPASPLAPGTNLCGWVLLEPRLVPDEFKIMERSDGGKTWFLAAVPLYREEMNLKLSQGTEKLEELFAAASVTELIDPKRVNVALKQ